MNQAKLAETVARYRPLVERFAEANGNPEAVSLNFETGELLAFPDLYVIDDPLGRSPLCEYVYITARKFRKFPSNWW